MTQDTVMKKFVSSFILVASLLSATAVMGYSYGPESQAEWDGWPEYCKARFTVSLIGRRDSAFGSDIGPDVTERWKNELGDCFGYLHHHCAAVLQLNRAQSARKAQDRNFALEAAIKEDKFAADNCPASNPFSANIATHMAMTFAEGGALAKANEFLDRAIQTHPSYGQSYLVKAALLKKSGKAAAARDVLLEGNEATNGKSAEIHNALGFSYLNSKEYEKAREHARQAYVLGFPLPGLRDRLAKAGYGLQDQAVR
jgi:tetratricopeptide (TPR) repeat protein